MSAHLENPPALSCRTCLVSDLPADRDAFGPHSRIADSIAASIRAEPIGRSIGIEGKWGSGKSTVINFLNERFRADDNIHFWVFDAWSHEGDPLRRSFLEELIEDLVRLNWLAPRSQWEKTVRGLTHRTRKERTETKARVTAGGFLVGFGLLLVPLGNAVFDGAVADGISLNPRLGINWIAALGTVLMAGPVVLPLTAWLLAKLLRRLPFARSLQTLSLRDAFTPIAQVHDTEINSETSEDLDPSSVDFGRIFDDVLDAALSNEHPARRLVIVLDNLDRVMTEAEAQRIWATLQPYTQARTGERGSRKKLWLVVTYDRRGIANLAPAVDQSGDPILSYIDKTIRVEYPLPSPVLSNWRAFLRDRLSEALPEHDGDELEDVVRLASVLRPAIRSTPTPRELVQTVNAIGAYHRLFGHDIPLTNIAYHVLDGRAGGSHVADVQPVARRIVKETIDDDRFALAFGVPRAIARQLRVGDEALAALVDGNREAFEEVRVKTEGLWTTIEVLVQQRVGDWELSTNSVLLRALGVSESYDDTDESRLRLRQLLKDAASGISVWDKFDAATDRGATVLDAPRRPGYVLQRLTSLQEIWTKENRLERLDMTAFRSLVLGLVEMEHTPIGITNPRVYAHAAAIGRMEDDRGIWQVLRYAGDPEEFSTWFGEEPVLDRDRLLMRALGKSSSLVDWPDLAGMFAASITRNTKPDVLRWAMLNLIELSSLSEEPRDAARAVVDISTLQDVLSFPEVLKSPELIALTLYLLVTLSPSDPKVTTEIDVPTASLLVKAGRHLHSIASSEHAVDRVWSSLKRTGLTAVASGFARAGLPHGLVSVDAVLGEQRKLSELGVLTDAVKQLGPSDVAHTLIAQPFSITQAELHAVLLELGPERPFIDWLVSELTRLSEGGWKQAFSTRRQARHAAYMLRALREHIPSLQFGTALQVALGNALLTAAPYVKPLSDFLRASAADDLRDNVFAMVLQKRKRISYAEFYKHFGDLLAQAPRFRSRKEKAVEKIMVPIVRNRTYPVAALEWLAETIAKDPSLILERGKAKRRRFLEEIDTRRSEAQLSEKQRAALDTLAGLIEKA